MFGHTISHASGVGGIIIAVDVDVDVDVDAIISVSTNNRELIDFVPATSSDCHNCIPLS